MLLEIDVHYMDTTKKNNFHTIPVGWLGSASFGLGSGSSTFSGGASFLIGAGVFLVGAASFLVVIGSFLGSFLDPSLLGVVGFAVLGEEVFFVDERSDDLEGELVVVLPTAAVGVRAFLIGGGCDCVDVLLPVGKDW